MNSLNDNDFHAEIQEVFATATHLEDGFCFVKHLLYRETQLDIAVNSANDFYVRLPTSIDCTPCHVGRILVAFETLEYSRRHDLPLVLSGLFLILQASTVREAAAIMALLYSYLSSSTNASFSNWLKQIADLFAPKTTEDQVGVAGELLFLAASIQHNRNIVQCWNIAGFSPFDFSPPPGLNTNSPYEVYFEIKTTSLGSGLYTLKLPQILHQSSISPFYAYAFVGLCISSEGQSISQFGMWMLQHYSSLHLTHPEIYQVLCDKVEVVHAIECLSENQLKFNPVSSTIRVVTNQGLPIPEGLSQAIVIDKFYLAVDMLATLSVSDYFSSDLAGLT
jgi:hypothetical protein